MERSIQITLRNMRMTPFRSASAPLRLRKPRGRGCLRGRIIPITTGEVTISDSELIYSNSQGGTVTYLWTQVGGPVGCAQIASPTSLNTPISFARKGDYTFRLTATQTIRGNTLSGYDEVRIQVQFPYKVNAGEYEDIRLPKPLLLDAVNSTDVGTAKDVWIQDLTSSAQYDDDITTTNLPNLPSGVVVTWSMVKGPGTASFNPPASDTDRMHSSVLNPSVQFSKAGKYTLRLSAGTSTGQTLASDEVEITALPGKLISARADHSLVVFEDSIVRACGYDGSGQLGNGIGCDNQPVFDYVLRGQQPGTHRYLRNITDIATGNIFSLALDNTGNVWSWGAPTNEAGLGRPSSESYSHCIPGQVLKYTSDIDTAPLDNITEISAIIGEVQNISENLSYGVALDKFGQVWTWGRGPIGENLSTPSSTYYGCDFGRFYANKVLRGEQNSADYLQNIIAIDGGWHHILALNTDGKVFSWGCNVGGALGDPDHSEIFVEPVFVHKGLQQGGDEYLSNIVAVSAGCDFSVAIEKQDGSDYKGRVYTWGTNWNGQLGSNSNVTNSNSPVIVQYKSENDQIKDITGIIAISAGRDFCLALDNDHHVWAWGNNTYGQLGTGTNTESHVAVPVLMIDPDTGGTISFGSHCKGGIVQISAGYSHCLAVDAEGAVWAWGGGEGSGPNATGFDKLGIGLIQQNVVYPTRVIPEPLTVVNQNTGFKYETITEAINGKDPKPAAANGDTLVAYPGEYYERVDFGGKNITLTSLNPDDPEIVASTIINGGGGGNAVTIGFDNYAYSAGKITGFTIRGGSCGVNINSNGSEVILEKNNIVSNAVGIEIIGSCPTTITDNDIAYNKAGIHCERTGSKTISRNRIVHNMGAGIVCWECTDATCILNNFVFNNGSKKSSYDSYTYGTIEVQDGIVFYGSFGKVYNNTVVSNSLNGVSARHKNGVTSHPDIRNCILWGNGTDSSHNLDTANNYGGVVDIYNCCIEGGATGTNNISADPKLESGFVLGPDSPCIDAGDNSILTEWIEWLEENNENPTDIVGTPRIIDGERSATPTVDIGAYEFRRGR